MPAKVLILGATSSIARAAAMAFAERGASLFLAARDDEELRRIAADIALRHGTRVEAGRFDALAYDEHASFLNDVVTRLGGLDGVLLAFGFLPDAAVLRTHAETIRVVNANFTGAASILALCADRFEAAPLPDTTRFIIAIGSVAGDRGRKSNYVYGAAKGGLALFMQGLRNRLFASGVHVITIKPGFVDTAMTFGMKGMFLVADPAAIGRAIAEAPDGHADVVYLPWFWRYIMLVIRFIPERVFKRLNL